MSAVPGHPTRSPRHPTLLRTGRALLVAVLAAALLLVGYDAWLWVFSDHAFTRITGLQLDAQVNVHIRRVDSRLTAFAPPRIGEPATH
jgi:hypothetical protein